MPKHSPAPWTIHRASEHTDDKADTGIMSIRAADGTTVLYTDSGYFKPTEENAALVAAAPDLLRAIVDALPILRDQAHRFPAPEWDHMARAFREAVAKATVKG